MVQLHINMKDCFFYNYGIEILIYYVHCIHRYFGCKFCCVMVAPTAKFAEKLPIFSLLLALCKCLLVVHQFSSFLLDFRPQALTSALRHFKIMRKQNAMYSRCAGWTNEQLPFDLYMRAPYCSDVKCLRSIVCHNHSLFF